VDLVAVLLGVIQHQVLVVLEILHPIHPHKETEEETFLPAPVPQLLVVVVPKQLLQM
jgi:hypothetical protein